MSLRRIVALAIALLFLLEPVGDAAGPRVVRHGPRGRPDGGAHHR